MSAGQGNEEATPPVRRQWLSDRVESLRQDLQPLLATNGAGELERRPSVTSTWEALRGLLPEIPRSLDGSRDDGAKRRSFVDALRSSGQFRAPDSDVCLADEVGLSEEMHGLRGTMFAQYQTDAGAVRELRETLAKRMDSAWSNEALRRGVASAKAGDYDSAQQAYDQALELDGNNADALVARGAARANQGQFRSALDDMEAALKIESGDLNAKRYKEIIIAKLCRTESDKLTSGGEVLEYRSGMLESKVLSQEKGPLPVVGQASGGLDEDVRPSEDERIQDAMRVIESAAKRKHSKKKKRKRERRKQKSHSTKSSKGKLEKHNHQKKKRKTREKKSKSSRGGERRLSVEVSSDSSRSQPSISG
ncbi:hypothetical protein BSKO_11836 [Bryopsis sp. KO-2023]|nr:hypothetical protein BSKO_11836 [Bryopsis sp. KO-2023]